MLYPFITLNDGTEIVHSEMLNDGRVKVYLEKPDEKAGFHHATCYLPTYEWEDIFGFQEKEIAFFQKLIEDTAHLILEFSQKGGFRGASGIQGSMPERLPRKTNTKYGLSDSLIEQIKAIAERHEVLKLVLFGSRACGNFRTNSDIDLAAYGLLPRNEMTFLSALDDLPTLLKIDTVVVRRDTDPAFLKEIEESGIVLLERQKVYAEQFSHALLKLQEAVVEAQTSPSTVIRDGVLHRFEIASEMAWRACHEALLADGNVNIDSPKATMRQAYAAGLIDDEATWLALLQTKNQCLNMYEEGQAEIIYKQIEQTFLSLCEKLVLVL